MTRGGNAGRPAQFRSAPHKARTPRAAPPRPAYMLTRGPAGRPAFFFFIYLFL